MKIIVSTHQGKLYDEEVDYIVVKQPEGEFALLKDHIALVTVIPTGYIKLVADKQELFLAIENGMLEFKDNRATVIAQGAHIGRDKDSALKHLESVKNDRLESNRKVNADYAQKEKEILDNLHKSQAGKL